MPKTKTPAPTQEDVPVLAEAAPATPAAKPKKRAAPAPAEAVVDTPKASKAVKPKLVRDSFTIPKDEYQVLDLLKARALTHETPVKKSELLRAGIRALEAMSDRAFLNALKAVPTLKTGRPKVQA